MSEVPKAYGINRLRDTWTVREATHRSMRANKSRDTGPEKTLRAALWAAGLRGYRKNDRRLIGSPDIHVPRAALCVFVHGCFWHGCDRCNAYRLPSTNRVFWQEKVDRNRARHRAVVAKLEAAGYVCLTVWECDIKRDCDHAVAQILATVHKRTD